jgi:predicted nucleic acid-binding protein
MVMKKLKIYLDTSVINFLFADDAPELKKITVEFFEKYVKTGIYDVYVSDAVIHEINTTNDENKRNDLLNIISEFYLNIIESMNSEEAINLTSLYIDNGIFTKKSLFDAYHVAIATINNMDILLSWNFKHLANIERERRILSVNLVNNYSGNLRIITPLEVFKHEDL